jgi:ribosomal protein S12 methylthiotransferase
MQSKQITRITPAEGTPAPKVGFVSLGCPKALVDSEQILTQLRAEGYETAKSYDRWTPSAKRWQKTARSS